MWEYVTIQQAQKIYIIVIYVYTAYTVADSAYSTTRKVYGIYRAGKFLSSSLYGKWCRWRHLPTKDKEQTKTTITSDGKREIELSQITSEDPVISTTSVYPSSLDEAVIEYFA